jgi:hypothetical protein
VKDKNGVGRGFIAQEGSHASSNENKKFRYNTEGVKLLRLFVTHNKYSSKREICLGGVRCTMV